MLIQLAKQVILRIDGFAHCLFGDFPADRADPLLRARPKNGSAGTCSCRARVPNCRQAVHAPSWLRGHLSFSQRNFQSGVDTRSCSIFLEPLHNCRSPRIDPANQDQASARNCSRPISPCALASISLMAGWCFSRFESQRWPSLST